MTPATLKDVLDHLPGGLLLTDKESRVLYASAALERRTGFSVAEIVGKKPGELWGGKMRKQFYSSLWQTIGTERQPFVGEVHNTKKNGAKKDEHIFIAPIKNENGETAYYAEIHPELSGRESEVAFGREFLARTGSMAQDQDFFAWVFETLRRKKDGSLQGTEYSFWQGGFQNATQFLQESFIAPMERLFLRRRDDALLVTRAQEHPEQFAQLYEKYVTPVRAYFLRRLEGDGALSEDLTQEVFVRAFRYLPGFRMTNASYYTYLLRIAHNVLMNHFRGERLDTVALHGNEEEHVVLPPSRVLPDLEHVLERLSETERMVMMLKYRDGLKIRAIAEKIGKTENAVKLLLCRTRKKLKKSLL